MPANLSVARYMVWYVIMDAEETKAHWNRRYQRGLTSLTAPDPFFISAYKRFVEPAFPRTAVALDLAGGLGRHALWLARLGWRVTVVDVSEVAIQELKQTAAADNIELDLIAIDAAEYRFEPSRFDLVVLFYHLDRTLFPNITSALKPGGLLVCKLAVRWYSGPKLASGTLDSLARSELPSLVANLCVLHHQERPVRERGVVEFVGRKKGVGSATSS
jgi:SAM-dependent methyltransferase